MKKIILSVLMLGVMLVIIGIVGADIDGVAFNTPLVNENISGTFNVSWNNTGYPDLDLQYGEGGCNVTTWNSLINGFNETVKSYLWNTSARTDGIYCLRIWGSISNETLSGNFTIDNTAPNITFDNTPYSAIVNASIIINATLVDGNYVKNYTIDFGDTSADNETDVNSSSGFVNQSHSYNSSGQYTITITARDNAGNSAVSTKIVTVNAETPDWIIELSASSQNLFSIPFVPNDTSYSSSYSSTNYRNALGGIVGELDRIWAYTFDTSTNTNSWKYRKTTSTGWSTASGQYLDDIVPGYGYIAFMKNDSVLYGNAKMISNDATSTPVIPSSVKLANDYNLIGMFGDPTNKSAENILSSLISLAGEQYWHKLYYVNGTEKTGNLTSEEGYWISMKHLPDTATDNYYTYFP